MVQLWRKNHKKGKIMDIASIAQQVISQKLGQDIDTDTITDALSALTGDMEDGFSVGTLVSKLSSFDGLGDMLSSWLGDGENLPIDMDTIMNAFNGSEISEFASKLGIDQENATHLLSELVPNIVDSSSSGGSLLDSIGGIEGAMGMLKKFF